MNIFTAIFPFHNYDNDNLSLLRRCHELTTWNSSVDYLHSFNFNLGLQIISEGNDQSLLPGIVLLAEDDETDLTKELGHFQKVIPSNTRLVLEIQRT